MVRENGIDWLMRNAGPLWPKLANRVGLTGFDFNQLVGKTKDGKLLTGDGANMRSNVDPTEHYVLSLPGTTRYRLCVEDAGLTNLIPVGDWLNTGINSGDAEAATIAGPQASRKLTGQPAVIPGEVDILGKKGD